MRPVWSSPYRNAETPAVYALLAAMGIVFLVDFYTHSTLGQLLWWPISPRWLHSLQLWQPFTFPFVHGTNFLYLAMDGLVLYFFGGSLERAWGTAKFLFFFFAAGIVPGLVELALSPWFGSAFFAGMIGGFVAMVVAFAAMNPYATVLLLIFPMQARWLAVLSVAIELFARNGPYGGPIAASLAIGITAGFAYVFATRRFSIGGFSVKGMFGRGGPSMRERVERWQQKRRMRQWQRRVSRAERPEDLFKNKK